MKKIVSIAVAALIAAAPLFAANEGGKVDRNAERPLNEIAVDYGMFTIMDFAFTVGGVFATAFTGGLAALDELKPSGAFGIEYHRYVHPHVAVGGILGYEHFYMSFKQKDGKDENGNSIYKKGSSSTSNLIFLMPSVKFPWFNRDHFGMYSKVAGGAMIQVSGNKTSSGSEEEKSSPFDFSWSLQVNPIGMEFGGTAVRGFLEMGWGMQGFLVGGVKYAF